MKLALASALVLIAAGLGGCITQQETIVRDCARAPIEFESDTAARIFYEILSKHPQSGVRSERTTQVEIPVVLNHKQRVVSGPNMAFNEAVSACDTNKDGKITEMEARIFAQMREPQK